MEKIENSPVLEQIGSGLKDLQEDFVESKLGKALNVGLDIGLRVVLPDLIENQVIEVKDCLMEHGLKDGIKETINNAKEYVSSTASLLSGSAKSFSQIHTIVKRGGVLNTFSKSIDLALEVASKTGAIEKTIATSIKRGKNAILKEVERHVEKEVVVQEKAFEKLEGLISKWNEFYKNQDLENMEKTYKSIERQLEKVVPMSNVLNKTKSIENIQNLIKNNGGNFDLSEEQLELANKLY